MEGNARTWFTPKQKAELWERWKSGQLAFRSVVGILLTAFTIPPLLARIRAEETMLKSQFADEYEIYRTRTSRLIPWLY